MGRWDRFLGCLAGQNLITVWFLKQNASIFQSIAYRTQSRNLSFEADVRCSSRERVPFSLLVAQEAWQSEKHQLYSWTQSPNISWEWIQERHKVILSGHCPANGDGTIEHSPGKGCWVIRGLSRLFLICGYHPQEPNVFPGPSPPTRTHTHIHTIAFTHSTHTLTTLSPAHSRAQIHRCILSTHVHEHTQYTHTLTQSYLHMCAPQHTHKHRGVRSGSLSCLLQPVTRNRFLATLHLCLHPYFQWLKTRLGKNF